MRANFEMRMIVQCYECAEPLEFIIVNNVSRGNGDMFQIAVKPCPVCSAQQSVYPTCGDSAPLPAFSTDGANLAPEHLSIPPHKLEP